MPTPVNGTPITYRDGTYAVPNDPIIPFIEGDGTGRDIWRASKKVFDAAVARASGGKRRVAWVEMLAGEKAFKATGSWLPEATLETVKQYRIGIKGPLTTPVGGGIRSLNVALRQLLDLYACVRPVRYFEGVPSPVKRPQDLNVIIFRENTEDVYAGIEYQAGSKEATRLRDFLVNELKAKLRPESAIGIKPFSEFGSKRLVARALQHAIDKRLPSVTLVHKGNIMKFTEGAFRDWGYQVAQEPRFAGKLIAEADLDGQKQGGRVLVKDRIADSIFQQVLLRPKEYSVLATPNLNGDYLSDACAAQVGGLGMAPGANIGDGYAMFEATHGTAPKYADLDKVNPCSVILSGVMMFEHLGWDDVAASIVKGIEGAIAAKRVTYDLARQMEGAQEVPTSVFADAIVAHLG
ncbi:MAG TPA: isocitrate dehydrogenase (NADP(+)) [Gemmatimonadales bacterium]|nr:isocitrate dehydrogenase (NADP(+)) [Gemmatimonadales bacterium]